MGEDKHGVRVEPPVIIFDNTVPGNVYTINITVKIVASTSRSIRCYKPKDKHFKLKVKNPEQPLAPGLCLPAILKYEPTDEVQLTDRLVITVDGEIVEVPILSYPCRPALAMPAEVDFGNVLANSKVVAKEISLVNSGSKAGDFKIDYKGSKPISIIPDHGSVPPNSIQLIKVEFVFKTPGVFVELAEVELAGREPFKLKITGNPAKLSLEVLSLREEEPIKCVPFGNTYFGTDRTEQAILYNNGPEIVHYVAIVDEEAVAQELGFDRTATLTDETEMSKRGHTNEITSLVTAIPNQGVLLPYQKVPIFFRFSPRWNSSTMGWMSRCVPPPRKDFALFIRLEIVGSSNGFVHQNMNKKSCSAAAYVEIAMTGTALPVLLDISPSDKLDFGQCPVGEHADVLCTIRNKSAIKPAIFEFRRIAQFSVNPPNGKIPPGQAQDVIFSFAPKQVGSFKPLLLLDVLGQVADEKHPMAVKLKVITTVTIHLSGYSKPITVKPKAKMNPGLTPYITNEVGINVETTFADLEAENPRNAIAGATKTRLHRLRPRSMDLLDNKKVKVAFPNDRPRSVRPTEHNQPYKTLFLGVDRYQYIDPDYEFTDDIMVERKNHRHHYIEHLHTLHDHRQKNRELIEYYNTNNCQDIGMKSAAGLKPRKLKQTDIKPDTPTPSPPNAQWKLLSTNELADAQLEAMAKPVQKGLNAVPVTQEEIIDCKKWLNPQELHQVIIGPPTIDIGKVCLRSVSQKELTIINNLMQYIIVEAEIDCRELRQSSPLSQVVPPRSMAVIPIIFESSTNGNFQRSVTYTINKFYQNHVTVTAEVVPVGLELSTDLLVVKPTPGLPADAGIRGVITLYNRLNYQAEFTWLPILGPQGTAFSIRPATGTVNALSSLDCEVVWHPSFISPEEGSFQLLVTGGSTLNLVCQAEVGTPVVNFMENRLTFGSVPINLTTTKIAMLYNSGHNHTYFQVLDPNPFPGLTVQPVHGVVPVGGSSEIRVSLTPETILKFDTRLQVAIKGSKIIELRLGGSVESPEVDIDVSNFMFGGVYCGSRSMIPFKMVNKTNTRTKMEFNLTRYKDFTLKFPGFQTPEDYNFQLLNPGMACVTLGPKETITGELYFVPQEVAAYDFIMPVMINNLGAPSPASTPFPPSPSVNERTSIIHSRLQPVIVITPRKHVIATALRQPLQLSHSKIEFVLPTSFYEQALKTGLGITTHHCEKTTVLVNNTTKTLKWGLDLRKVGSAMEAGILKFLHPSGIPFISDGSSNGIEGELNPGQTRPITIVFCPKNPGFYEAVVPVVIDNQWSDPYQMLYITGQLKEPKIWFDPPGICMTPVPLLTDFHFEFNLFASQYSIKNKVTVETPQVECEDGDTISPVKVTFLQGNEIEECSGDNGQIDPCCLPCRVTFSSPKPVSFTKPIIFKDGLGNSFSFALTATADNSILTCYAFLALNRITHTIVRESIGGDNTISEAIIVPVNSPAMVTQRLHSRPSTSATSSNFQVSSASYEHSNSTTDSTRDSTPGPRDGAMNKPPTSTDPHSRANNRTLEVASRLGSAMFPDENSEEGIFHMEVLAAVQRWFTAQGWPGGPNPITVPETLRMSMNRRQGEGRSSKQGRQKDTKTLYDMINHLSGRPVPGIPVNSHLPSDPVERVKQIYWQHSTLLTFLRCQGACLASIHPEYMMTPRDFQIWRRLQMELQEQLRSQNLLEAAEGINVQEDMEDEVFEAVSKRTWTDILLQILKVLVLAKVTPRAYKYVPVPSKEDELPHVSPDPLSSNVYSIGERHLLAWLNHYYNRYRTTVWQGCRKGGVPSSRWVVNFDLDLMDGLVLGAVFGAHMPFIIKTHLEDMYTKPETAEQCLHNALKLVTAMRFAGMDYDIQAVDITDPNPLMMLLLVMQLFQMLPHYLSKSTLDFTGTLHSTVSRQVKVSNPSTKPLTYQILIAGRDARDFNVPKGSSFTIGARQTVPLSVEFSSRYLRPAEAFLVLIGSRQGLNSGSTLTFKLQTQIDNVRPRLTKKVESPCYELERVILNVENPFDECGRFSIILVDSGGEQLDPNKPHSFTKNKEKKTKKVRSKMDSGQLYSDTTVMTSSSKFIGTKNVINEKSDEDFPQKGVFFSPMQSVYLEAHSSEEVEVDFLPFSIGDHQCSVIFQNESIGEFLYSIEAKALLPLPLALPFFRIANSARVSNITTADEGSGVFGGNENVIYWKCEANQLLHEKLVIPMTNVTKERALILAAQQHMSDEELERRNLTGTLMSSSVKAKTTKMLDVNPSSFVRQAKEKGPVHTVYLVEYDSEYFRMPEVLNMPSQGEFRFNFTTTATKSINLEGSVSVLPVEFRAKNPGHYPCQIIMRSQEDIRVYRIECLVNPEGNIAEMSFSAPVHQSILQEIPIVNGTDHDWHLTATVEGEGFSGPLGLLAKASLKSSYPLVFQPMLEKEVKGKLTLTNSEDGQDQVFFLTGKAEKPLALDHLKLKIEAKTIISHTIKVPNATKKKLYYRVETDLPFITGSAMIEVLPRQLVNYTFTMAPRRRGTYPGVIAFIACPNPVREVDSDGDEIPMDLDVVQYDGYRVWYSLDVIVRPPPPEKVLDVTCACQKKLLIEVIVRNPTPEDIELKAMVTGRDLEGPDTIFLEAGEKDAYSLVFAPVVIGKSKGSLVFYNDLVGEFWYDLNLDAQPPLPTTLPHMECELGKFSEQMIVLENMTEQILELIPTLSNNNNFCVLRDNERPLVLRPKSVTEIPLNFMPSSLGNGDHNCKIVFNSPQLGEWVFLASGTGLLPHPQAAVSIYTAKGASNNIIIPFRNPMDTHVLASVQLKDHTKFGDSLNLQQNSPFSLLLKNTKFSHRVGPKATLDIPIRFTPTEMRKYNAVCTVIINKEDGTAWDFVPTDDLGYPVSRTSQSGVTEIRWVYPIYGIPESQPIKDSQCTVVQCQARDSVEQSMEVMLTNVVVSNATQDKKIQMKTKNLLRGDSRDSSKLESIVVGEGLQTANEFILELYCPKEEMKDILPNSVQLSVLLHDRNAAGIVTIVFNIKFSPFRTMNYLAYLNVTGALGGLWKFPVRFVATDPPVDDVIKVEASGLGKMSTVGFKLHSQTKCSVAFHAYFEEGSDPELTVSPSMGELQPQSMEGTLFTISFNPYVYGKLYKGKLIVQCPDMQWSYDVHGVLPEYAPPQGRTSIPARLPVPVDVPKNNRNFILENLKLLTTGVCSPIKGAPLCVNPLVD